jgi:Cu(I)/Ag(I) efflux system membrane fusion protein/cobalt-zinc-cadmium efflux system membrane fusion protein
MKLIAYMIILIMTAAIIGCSDNHKSEIAASGTQDYYTCPMHPEIVQDEPGDCPICGMDLVLGTRADDDHEHSHQSQLDSVEEYLTIDPVMVQNMGVRVEHAEMRKLRPRIRTIGRLEAAEDRSYSMNLKYSGWVERIWADKTGEMVQKNDKLFEIYSPELIAAQEEYLNAVQTYGADNSITRSVKKKMQLWDVPADHLEDVVRENNPGRNLIVRSPGAGFIMHKTIQAGSYVRSGTDLYHLADLSSIWVMAEVYENQIPFIKVGQEVEFTITNLPGGLFTGKIDHIYPELEKKTRTQKLRIVLDNSAYQLKPGMYADVVIFNSWQQELLSIPSSAVIRNGGGKLVFVSYDIGKYKPQTIETGVFDDSSGYIEVISGLQEGDLIVTSGQFLLDSESQLREAVEKLLAEKLQISNTAEHNDHSSESPGTYFTCPMHPNIVEEEAGECPICGMDLIEKEY